MTQFEFYKSFQFVIELLLAEAMFVFRFRRRRFFRLLLPAAVILCFAFAWLMPVLLVVMLVLAAVGFVRKAIRRRKRDY